MASLLIDQQPQNQIGLNAKQATENYQEAINVTAATDAAGGIAGSSGGAGVAISFIERPPRRPSGIYYPTKGDQDK